MRITNGSKIISNDTSKASYSNDPNVKGVKGDEVPLGGHATDTGSIVGATAPKGSLLGFASIASIGGPGTYTPECTGSDAHPDNLCIICYNGRWTHKSDLDPCNLYAEVFNPVTLLPECSSVKYQGCEICGPCFKCNSEGVGDVSCDEMPGDDLSSHCLECDNSAGCGADGNPYSSTCDEANPRCCNGTCVGWNDCCYEFPEGSAFFYPGCPPLTCSSCEFGNCIPGGLCGDCQKCDTGVCVDDPDGYDSEGNPCYEASSLDTKLMP